MFEYFHFSLPRAVTEQLVERLEQLESTPLSKQALKDLAEFQIANRTVKGVYVIYQGQAAVYAGKADGVAGRLEEHFEKLCGRQGINLGEMGLKALLLDDNWSTSANEYLLIEHFKRRSECRWNGNGFGPKDPGKNRDGSVPNWFDKTYPVRDDYPVENIRDDSSIAEVLAAIKAQIPYLFRYDVPAAAGSTRLDLAETKRTVRDLAIQTARTLGDGWQLMLFKNGFTLYKVSKTYEHGEHLVP